MSKRRTLVAFFFVILAVSTNTCFGQERKEVELLRGMKLAASFFRNQVARHGGYVYFCSEDLKQRWGEGKADNDTIFVQPPATPHVGETYLSAYQVTQDPFYLDAAKETAQALVQGQLQSGGWAQVIHFSVPQNGRMGNYRKRKGGSWNNSSLDDNQTQAALRFLARTDQALDFQHEQIHEAVIFGLDALVAAQFNIGAFPQSWTGPAQPQPVLKADYPNYDWRTEGRIKDYWNYYTLNDGLAGTVAETLIVAHEIYGDEKYKHSLIKLGNFLLAAQMPDPQPAWCQQYNFQMQPMWARKFEPPAITGSESQDVMDTLIDIADYTGDKTYLDPIPRAVRYFEQSGFLPDGKLARYYELKTNRPLYMTSNYELTYDEGDVPSHYSWKVSSGLERIKRNYEKVASGKKLDRNKIRRFDSVRIKEILDQLDSQGRWVSKFDGERLSGQPKFPIGFRYISSDVFNENMAILCSALENIEAQKADASR